MESTDFLLSQVEMHIIPRLPLVLLGLFLQFHAGTPAQGTVRSANDVQEEWETKYTPAVYNFAAAVSANCFGYIRNTDPLWLGSKEFIYDKKSQNRVLSEFDYTRVLRKSDLVTTLTVYSINYKGKPLFGWFHLKLSTSDPNVIDFRDVVAQVETDQDHFAQAGSFVRTNFNRASSCATKNAENKVDYKPCNYATDPFMTAQQLFIRRANPPETTYEWNVKLEFPLCHIYYNNNALYFRIYILTEKSKAYTISLPLQKWIYLVDHVYGAPDPKPPANAMADCTAELGGNSSNVSWVTGRSNPIQNVTHWDYPCSYPPITGAPSRPPFSWGGRCCLGYHVGLSQKKPLFETSPEHRYNCHRQKGDKTKKYIFGKLITTDNNLYTGDAWFYPKAPVENWTYPEINEYNREALKAVMRGCDSEACRQIERDQYRSGVSASSDIGRYIYAGRQGHAILMVMGCLFVYPLTNFVSRYFKGSFMTSRYIVNLHPWYSIHIYGTLTTLTFLTTGLGIGIYARKYLGYSYHKAARAHVSLGYISILLFFGGIFSNGLRCGRIPSKNRSIILHACFGVLFYYLSLITTAVAVWIPASPGNAKEKRSDSADTARFGILVAVTIVFPIFEVILHVIGTMQMSKPDARFHGLRDWAWFVAIPRVAADEKIDEAGTSLMSHLFVGYVVGTTITTIIALSTIVLTEPGGRFFGPMTYTHVKDKLSTEYIERHEEFEDVLE